MNKFANEPIWDDTSSDLDIEPLPRVAADKGDQPELTRAKYRKAFNENKVLRNRITELEGKLEEQEQAWREREEIGNKSGQALVDSYKSRVVQLERGLTWIVNSPSAHPANMVKVAEDALSHAGPDGEQK